MVISVTKTVQGKTVYWNKYFVKVGSEQETQVSDLSFTPCLRSGDEVSSNVNVEFTTDGVQISHYNFETQCNFTTVNTTYTFEDGILNIIQQGDGDARCICYTDVSYTIKGISQNQVDVIFINGVQVYCQDDNEDPQTENLLIGKWLTSFYRGDSIIVFTEDLCVRQYLDYIFANQVIPAFYPSTFVTYSLFNNEITFTIHYFYPSIQKMDETYKYVLNGNSLIIKGFSNPFSPTKEGRRDVHFTKIP
jgi:hypothetical protein